MESALKSYERRVRSLNTKYRKLADGYELRLGSNGLLEHAPVKVRKNSGVRALAILFLCFTTFKAFLLASMGPEAYMAHLATLRGGSVYETIGGFLMIDDPVTRAIASLFH